ncbi:MAG TPA: carboxymuconolactone decarboxylase family protein [Longimicrobiaceae bacterium]|jgi:AhpD family alkylhydroperoxidase|nr:carboxymuconolactone decarboxylase family protein [Longimicrobiaceae bacterium]
MSQRSAYQTLAADGMKALAGVSGYLLRSGLPKPLLDLVFLRASQINGCAFCIDMHTHDALKDGATAEKLMLLPAWREAGAYFSDRERAALAWTEAVTLISQTHAPDDVYQAAAAEFGEKEMADLTIAIGLINAYNRIAISFRQPPASLSRSA